MQVLNITGYKFINLDDLEVLRKHYLQCCRSLAIKGTILLSPEGININLSGTTESIHSFISFFKNDVRFNDISFRESYSDSYSFKRLKIKIKKEIITFRRVETADMTIRAPVMPPEQLKLWLDEKREFTLLDTRNDYEIQFGTFCNAINFGLKNFTEFPTVVEKIAKDKPIVMFCTGGIRCEKAAYFMLAQGFKNVYQLEGGIINYFQTIGKQHFEGECYVFDERVAVNDTLKSTGTQQCVICQGPIRFNQTSKNNLNHRCNTCVENA